jgi:hypothetical protein
MQNLFSGPLLAAELRNAHDREIPIAKVKEPRQSPALLNVIRRRIQAVFFATVCSNGLEALRMVSAYQSPSFEASAT